MKTYKTNAICVKDGQDLGVQRLEVTDSEGELRAIVERDASGRPTKFVKLDPRYFEHFEDDVWLYQIQIRWSSADYGAG